MQQGSHDPSQYADALIAMGQACNALPQIENDMLEALELLQSNAEMQQFLANPSVMQEGKTNALLKILQGRLHPVLVHFLAMLLTQHQLRAIKTIASSFFKQASELREQVSGDINTAVPISAERLAEIEEEVGSSLGKQVHLRHSIAPGILGGIYIKVGDFVIDGTVEHQLDTIRRQLTV